MELILGCLLKFKMLCDKTIIYIILVDFILMLFHIINSNWNGAVILPRKVSPTLSVEANTTMIATAIARPMAIKVSCNNEF